MTTKTFIGNAQGLVDKALKLLSSKNDKYNTGEDRLGNFKRAAELQHLNPIQAAAGHMSKHTVCLNDMIASGEAFTREQWEEEILDCLNYCILLYNLVEDLEDDFIKEAPAAAKKK